MNQYEVTVVLSAKLEDTARADAIERVRGYIARYNGIVGEVEEWGKRRLAYEIDRETEGYYYLINFDGDHTTPGALERELRIFEPVIRYLVVKKPAHSGSKESKEEAGDLSEKQEQLNE